MGIGRAICTPAAPARGRASTPSSQSIGPGAVARRCRTPPPARAGRAARGAGRRAPPGRPCRGRARRPRAPPPGARRPPGAPRARSRGRSARRRPPRCRSPPSAGCRGAARARRGAGRRAPGWPGVEAHRLGVEQRRQELGRVAPPQPGALVGQHGEGRRVRLGEAEVREADELPEDRPDDLVVHPARPGPVAELAPQVEHRLAAALAAHRAPQGLGLPGAEPGQRHRHLEHLLLEHHHAEGLAQAVGQQRVVVGGSKPGSARRMRRCLT